MDRYLEGQLIETIRGLVGWALAGLEGLLLGTVLLLVAIVVAKIVEKTLAAVLTRVGLNAQADHWGVTDTLARVGVQRPLAGVLGRLTFFIVLVFVAQVVADALDLSQISVLLGQVLAYVPRVLVAALILLLGSVAAGYGRRAVVQLARDSGVDYAPVLGTLFFGVVIFVLAVMAVNQLQIQTEAIWLMVGWLLGGLALGLGLAFGLGSREIVRNVLAGFYARQIFPIGKEVSLGDERGVLLSITPTKALLEQGDQIITVSNSTLIQEVVKRTK